MGSLGRRRLKICERPYGEVETLLVSDDDGHGRGKSFAEGRLQTQSKDIVPARLCTRTNFEFQGNHVTFKLRVGCRTCSTNLKVQFADTTIFGRTLP